MRLMPGSGRGNRFSVVMGWGRSGEISNVVKKRLDPFINFIHA
jgi:hypothetical protein